MMKECMFSSKSSKFEDIPIHTEFWIYGVYEGQTHLRIIMLKIKPEGHERHFLVEIS